jgi:hypothetical protein
VRLQALTPRKANSRLIIPAMVVTKVTAGGVRIRRASSARASTEWTLAVGVVPDLP